MINTKLYKSIYKLAEELLEADRKGNQQAFDDYYAQLTAICVDNDNTDKDHPEQWETLADFTADFEAAFVLYDKALLKATKMKYKDHQSSIGFSKAQLQAQLGKTDEAIKMLQQAVISANKIEDKDLKAEISELLAALTTDPKRALDLDSYAEDTTIPK